MFNSRTAIAAAALCIFGLAIEAAGQVAALPTAQTAVVGRFAHGPINFPILTGLSDFNANFGSGNPAAWPAEAEARQFFANGGSALYVVRVSDSGALADALAGSDADWTGVHALDPLSDLRVVIAPELSLVPAASFAATFASFRAFLEGRRIFLILDPPPGLAGATDAANWVNASVPANAPFCALYFPYLNVLIDGAPLTVGASGAMAAVFGKSDAGAAIWKSPSGTGWPLQAVSLTPSLSSSDIDYLVGQQVNPIRQQAPYGIIPWAARTLDRSSANSRYIAVVRTAQWCAACIQRALAVAATQDDAQALWIQITNLVGNFLNSLYQQGAFVGNTPSQCYFVKCDSSTTTAADIAAHRVNVIYGAAPIRASEFDLTSLSADTYDSLRPTPVPPIRLLIFAGNLLLHYPTAPGFNFLLETNTTLNSSSWASTGASVGGDGAWRRLSFGIGGDQQFFRLQITPAR